MKIHTCVKEKGGYFESVSYDISIRQ